MNILFVSEHAVHFGGIGAVIHQLCLGLQLRGHRCYLYTDKPPPADSDLLFDGIERGPLAAPARITDRAQHHKNRHAFRAMSSTLQHWRIDLVHCHEIHRSLFTAAHSAQCPIVVSSHGGVFHRRYQKRRLVRQYRRLAGKVSCVTVLNPAMQEALRQRFGDLFSTVTIANGIEDSWLTDDLAGQRDILLGVGRLSADKCYGLALDAYAASSSRQHYPLVIAGDGDEQHKLARSAQAHGIDAQYAMPDTAIPNTLYLTGYRSESSKKALYARARLFLHPSRFEAFGIVLLEAMAQGALPLCAGLATYQSQFPAGEFTLDYIAPDIQAWASAIDQRCSSGDLSPLVEANRKSLGSFCWSQIFERYMNVYSRALQERK